MQRLVCWTLMGVRTSGERDVWYQLGSFDTESSAAEAAASNYWASQGFHDISVVPYYRVDQNVTRTEAVGRPACKNEGRAVQTAV